METFKPIENRQTFSALKPFLEEKKQNSFFVWSITGMVFVLPLFFLTLTSDFYGLNKTTLFHFWTTLMLISWAIVTVFFKQEIKLQKNPLNLAAVGLAAVYLISSLTQSPNRMTSFLSSGMLMINLCFFYFLANHFIKGIKSIRQILIGLLAVSAVLSWLVIFAYLEVFKGLNLDWLNSKAWSPAGSAFMAAVFLAALIPGTFFWALKTKDATGKVLLFITGALQLIAVSLTVMMFFDKTLTLNYLRPDFGWQIAVEGFKSLRTALFGVGPGNFLSAFSRWRPIGLNSASDWTIKYTANSNQFLNILSTAGILGLAAYLSLFLMCFKKENYKGSLTKKTLYVFLAGVFIVQLVFNASFLNLLLTFVLLALIQADKKEDSVINVNSPTVIWIIGIVIFCWSLFSLYWQGRIWLADYYFGQSLAAANQNKGMETYNLQVKAVKFNPFSETYRLAYSNTNFALASALSAKENLTDQDKANITQLVSQTINEAKAAASLNPDISQNWINLAALYRNLINVVDGADQWAAASYLQAIKTDPTNPLLRVEFGGMFFGLKNYDQAINQFTQSINLKADFANGYYNLAAAYKAKEDWVNAYASLQYCFNLIPLDAPDYEKVSNELEELKDKLPKEEKPAVETEIMPESEAKDESRLTEPEPLPSPNARVGEVKLPKEAAPELPEAEVSPSPEASASPVE